MKNLSATIVAIFTFAGFTFPAIASVISPLGSAAENTAAIQAALDAAAGEAVPGTVTLGEGTFEINAQLMVTGGVTLVGQGWEKTIIKQTVTGGANNVLAENGRCATVSGGAVIKGLTLTGGHIRQGGMRGAGVLVDGGTVSWCKIIGNQFGDKEYMLVKVNNVYGAGVGFEANGGVIEHSIITGNTAYANGGGNSHGGGIGMYWVSSSVLIDTCLIFGNSAPAGNGGGFAADLGNVNVTIRNTTITENFAKSAGGAIWDNSWNHKIQVKNTIIYNNTNEGDASEVSGTLEASSSNNLIGQDPLFVDSENGDFHLSSASPCIGAGVSYEGIGVDLDNLPFDEENPSVGCYEGVIDPSLVILGDVAVTPMQNSAAFSVAVESIGDGASSATAYLAIGLSPDSLSSQRLVASGITGDFEFNVPRLASECPYYYNLIVVNNASPAKEVQSSGMFITKRALPDLSDLRKKIDFTVNFNGEAASVPVLVRLSEDNPVGFRYSDCAEDGSDIRFTGADGYLLPFEIDTWDKNGVSLVWIAATTVAKNATFTMYYKGTPPEAKDSSETWKEYTGVWHLNETSDDNTPNSIGLYANSTSETGLEGHLSSSSFAGEPGKFGKSFLVNEKTSFNTGNFNCGGVWVNDSGDNSPLDANGVFTISGWFKHGEYNYHWDHIFYKRVSSDNNSEPKGAFAVEVNVSGGNSAPIWARGASATPVKSDNIGTEIRDWMYLTFVYDGTSCSIYTNGVFNKKASIAKATDNNAPLVFGNNVNIVNGGTGDAAWGGWIDEVRYLKGAKGAEWIAAEYAAMADEAFLEASAAQPNPLRKKGMSLFIR